MSKKKLLSTELKDKYYKRGEESDALRDGKGMYWGGVISAFNEVITLVEKLKEEEPASNDLEEAWRAAYDKENEEDPWNKDWLQMKLEVVKLHVEGRSISEIAAKTGAATQTVKGIITKFMAI